MEVNCPVCLEQVTVEHDHVKCVQCVAIYHRECASDIECAACRYVYDQQKKSQHQAELLQDYTANQQYDEEYSEESEDEYDDAYYDEEYIPHFTSTQEASEYFRDRIITRAWSRALRTMGFTDGQIFNEIPALNLAINLNTLFSINQ